MSSTTTTATKTRLPTELWALIFSYSTNDLYNLSLISRGFNTLTTPLLYKTISLDTLGRIFRFIRTIQTDLDFDFSFKSEEQSCEQQLSVNSCARKRRPLVEFIVDLRFVFKKTWTKGGSLFSNSFLLIKHFFSLPGLKNLKHLNLDMDLVSVSPDTVLSCPKDFVSSLVHFRLTSFQSDLLCEAHMLNFLGSQPSLQRLVLGGPITIMFLNSVNALTPLPSPHHQQQAPSVINPPPTPSFLPLTSPTSNANAPFLPNLSNIDTEPELAYSLIRNRPITYVQLPLIEPENHIFPCLRQSSAPSGVTQLVLLLPRSTDPRKLIQSVADNVPGLINLSIYFGSGVCFDEVSSLSLSFFLFEMTD